MAGSGAEPRRGFTLLEILIAVAIFSVCASALLATFRISTRAFNTGRKAAATMQTLRFTVEQISRDLKTVYFETDYNQRFLFLQYHMRQNEFMEVERLRQELAEYEDGETEPGFVGLKLDLHFLGRAAGKGEGGKGASLEFAHFVHSDGTSHDESKWGAERVRYYLGGPDGSDLYRQRSSVQRVVKVNPNLEEEVLQATEAREAVGSDSLRDALENARDASGRGRTSSGRVSSGRVSGGKEKAEEGSPEDMANRIRALALRGGGILPPEFRVPLDVNYLIEEEPETYPPELIAENVTTFNLKFGHFSGDWTEVSKWDSDEKVNRTPEFNLLPDDPMFFTKLAAYQRRPTDYLPAYVKMTLGIQPADDLGKKKDKKSRHSQTIDVVIWMPSSLEIYVPEDDLIFETMEY